MNNPRLLLGLILVLTFNTFVQGATEVLNLRTEYLQNPIGIDKSTPRFSWEIVATTRDVKQIAYQIKISTDKIGSNEVWNSGKVTTDQSVNNKYQGPALQPSTRYFWQVDVWCNDKKISSTETAFFETSLLDSGWDNAQWIKSSKINQDAMDESGIPMFRKTFELEKKVIKSAKIYSSALGVYDLFINGKRVGTTSDDNKIVYDELKPGWTDYSKTVQYTTYDVTNMILQGNNVIGAQVASGWWRGPVCHGQYGNPDLGFIGKLVISFSDGSSKTVVTDNTWRTSSEGAVRMADIYMGETYDARKESTWNTIGYDDSFWMQTSVSNDFKGQLKAFVGPAVQVRPELTRQPVTITQYNGKKENGTTYGIINTIKMVKGQGTIHLKKDETVVYDMGQNMVGWVKFTAKSNAGTQMKIRFGEMLNDSGQTSKGNDGPAGSIYTANLRSAKATLKYTFKGAKEGETYQPSLTFFGFRYCEITATDDVQIESLSAEVVGSANKEGSSFKTSNPLVNQLYSNIIWGQRSNFLSIPTDCPQRDERLGWTGDTQIFSRAASYNADVASFFHKWMGDMRDSQRKDGAFPDVAPIAWVGYGQGAWGDAGIIVPWNIYLMYNDIDLIAENFESMEKHMDFLAAQAGNGFRFNGSGTNYGDWIAYEKTDNRYVSVCYYAYVARLMSKMSAALSLKTGDVYDMKQAKYSTLYEKIKDEYQKRYVHPDGSLKESSQTAYLLALKLGLFSNVKAKENGVAYLTKKIADNGDKLSTGFIGTGTLNQTLSENGAINTAYNLLLQRNNPSWLYSVDQGATTIWERWDSYTLEKGFGDVSMNSFNHYAYGAIGEWMFRYMAGIDTDESKPGFKHIHLQPMPDLRNQLPIGQERITLVEGKYHSYYGPVKSSWKMDKKGKIAYTIAIPANTTATLTLPLQKNTDSFFESGVRAEKAQGITLVRKEAKKVIFELKSGTYTFHVK